MVNELLAKEMSNLKSPIEFKIILSLSGGMRAEGGLSEVFRKDTKALRKIAFKLRDKGFIQILRHKENHEIVYVLDKRFFDLSEQCFSCKHRTRENTIVGVKDHCNRGKPPCKYLSDLTYSNILRFVSRHYEPAFLEVYNRKVNKREARHVDNWIHSDFIDFYIEQFREYFPKFIPPERGECWNYVKSISSKFRYLDKSKWKRLFKRYIWENIKEYSELGRVPTMIALNDNIQIQRFVKSVKNAKKCKFHHIYCTMFRNGKCNLPEGESGCTKSIRDKMLLNYN